LVYWPKKKYFSDSFRIFAYKPIGFSTPALLGMGCNDFKEIFGYWLLAISYWLLAIGYWLHNFIN
jgi:hypothetical protein